MLETTISKDNLSPYIAYQTVVKMINAKVTYNLVLSVSMSINGNLEFYRESPETIIKAIKQFAEINVKYSLKFHFKYDPNQTLVYQICLSITAALNNFSTHYQFLKTFNPTLRLFDTKDNTNTLIDSKYFTPQQVYSKLEYHFSNNPKHHLALIFSA